MPTPIDRLPRVSPESAGVSPDAIASFLNAVEAAGGGMHSFMLLRHGRVAAEGWWAPYGPAIPHALFSLSKSFTSVAVGLAISEGLLTVDSPVVSFVPDSLPADVAQNLAAMRVRHLLTMTTGHDEDATGRTVTAEDGDWVRAFLALPVEHAPGSKFVYNSAATYMCSAIVQRLTGQTVLDYLTLRLFEPLGIAQPTWDACPRGISIGGWGLNLRTEDIARSGQCCLQMGEWNGRQVIPAAWLREATAKQVPNGEGDDSDWTQGYGYQFWRCRHGAYRGDGAFGQFCVVMPYQDAVLAITSGVGEMQPILDAAWDHLLPGMDGPASPDSAESLPRKLAGLAIPAPAGAATSSVAGGDSHVTFTLEPNEDSYRTAAFDFSPDGVAVTLSGPNGTQPIMAGTDCWVDGALPGPGGLARSGAHPVGRVAARGAWTDDGTWTMRVIYIETPFIETVSCQFTAAEVTITRAMNVGFGPTERPALKGHAKDG